MSESAETEDQDLESETQDHHRYLRLWLRLLTCTVLVETEIRARLREKFSITLPQFDLMSQLDRSPGGLTMGELSKRLMVTNGNVTGIVTRLVEEGMVVRTHSKSDRRNLYAYLTRKGKNAFRAMAAQHEKWIRELLVKVEPGRADELMALLGEAKASVIAAKRTNKDLAAGARAPRAARRT